jgi:hypothetical protein
VLAMVAEFSVISTAPVRRPPQREGCGLMG